MGEAEGKKTNYSTVITPLKNTNLHKKAVTEKVG